MNILNNTKGEFNPSGEYAPTLGDARTAVEGVFSDLFSAANPGMRIEQSQSPEVQLPPEVISIQTDTAAVHEELRQAVLPDIELPEAA